MPGFWLAAVEHKPGPIDSDNNIDKVHYDNSDDINKIYHNHSNGNHYDYTINKDIERRCAERIEVLRQCDAELAVLRKKSCDAQAAWWQEEAAARRFKRKPDPQFAQAYVDAQSQIEKVKIEKRLFSEWETPKKTVKPSPNAARHKGVELSNRIQTLVESASKHQNSGF